jgi:hypothetical protein
MNEITCSAGCKRVGALTPDGTPTAGWEQLQITGQWRCPTCWRELKSANHILGTPSAYAPDPLPKDSIGALKKFPVPPPLHENVKS